MAEKKTAKKKTAKKKTKKGELPPNPAKPLGPVRHLEQCSVERATELIEKWGCHATKKRGPNGEILVYCDVIPD